MYYRSHSVCPLLKGDEQGVICAVTGEFVRDIVGSSMRICMTRHFEACSIYFDRLLNTDIKPIMAGIAFAETMNCNGNATRP